LIGSPKHKAKTIKLKRFKSFNRKEDRLSEESDENIRSQDYDVTPK